MRCKDTDDTKVKEQKNIPNGNQKKAEVAELISDKTDFKQRLQKRWALKKKFKKRWAVHNNNKVGNLTRWYKICIYICTQHRHLNI